MFFAEVRHFEEIFRQGEPPPSGSSQEPGNGQEAEKLAELQKQVINATWTLIRREAGPTPTAPFAADARAIEEAQHSAIEQANALGTKLRDPNSKEDLAAAVRSMKAAESKLGEASKGPAVDPLRPALASAQAAYQGLLKLRAREFEVSRRNQQQQGGGSSQGGPSQAQLDQLQLSNEENRYEQQSSAKAATRKEQEQRETRQVLNRLAELARRQGDLNDRLKELQAALGAAKEAQAREEIERQLKRLREQQQQVLRDADEVRERMEREENRERLAEERKKLEEGREHVRQASEALEKGQVSQAINEGTRAGRDLDELREDLRKKSSDRFGEEVAEIRDQARRLDEKQGELTRQLEAKDQPQAGRPSLRDDGPKDQARRGLEDQAKQLDGLMERMRQTVQEAEETEPLLARNLFDTVKKAAEQDIPNALDQGRSAGRGRDRPRGRRGLPQGRTGDRAVARGGREGRPERPRRRDRRPQAGPGGTQRPGQSGQPRRSPAPAAPRLSPANKVSPANPGNSPHREISPDRKASKPSRGNRVEKANSPARWIDKASNPDKVNVPAREIRRASKASNPDRADSPVSSRDKDSSPANRGSSPGRADSPVGKASNPGRADQGGPGDQPGQGNQPGLPGPGGGQPGGAQRGPGGGGLQRMLDGLGSDNNGGSDGPGGPITGDGFRRWSDRMRDVEDLLPGPPAPGRGRPDSRPGPGGPRGVQAALQGARPQAVAKPRGRPDPRAARPGGRGGPSPGVARFPRPDRSRPRPAPVRRGGPALLRTDRERPMTSSLPGLAWGAPEWLVGALVLAGVAALSLLWSYARAPARPRVKVLGALLKGLGFAALVLSLVEPMLTGTRPRRGANAFAILLDNSQSLAIRDDGSAKTRGEWLRDRLSKEAPCADPARPGLRRPGVRLRLSPPDGRGVRGARLRRPRLGPQRLPRRPRPTVQGAPPGRRPAVHRRQPNRPRRTRLRRSPADLSGHAPQARGHPRRRRGGGLGQPDQLRVGPRRRQGRGEGRRI